MIALTGRLNFVDIGVGHWELETDDKTYLLFLNNIPLSALQDGAVITFNGKTEQVYSAAVTHKPSFFVNEIVT